MISAIDAQGAVMHTDNGERWRRVVGAGAGGLRRVAGNAWPLLEGTAAATTAWVIARRLGDHPDPFFAPVAAVVALNASRGERGSNAVRLLVGVVAGELAIGVLGAGYGTLALATFAAMAVAVALGGARVMVAQAAASAILAVAVAVAVADGQAGPQRLVDALSAPGWHSCSRRSCSRRSRSRRCAVPRQRRLRTWPAGSSSPSVRSSATMTGSPNGR